MAKFQKGHKINLGRIPWNKGTKGIMKPNSGSFKKGGHHFVKTEFKKGQIPWNKGKSGPKGELTYGWKGGKPKCIDCGISTSSYQNKNRCRKCADKYYVGKKKHSWKGGITPINKRIRHSLGYRIWRKAVFEKDNYTCVWCKAKSQEGKLVYLHADHIKPFSLYSKLRFDVNNGRTLCENCHSKTPTYKNQLLDRDTKTGRFIRKIYYANL